MSFEDAFDICTCGNKLKPVDKYCSSCGRKKFQLNPLKEEENETNSNLNKREESIGKLPGYLININRNTFNSFPNIAKYSVNNEEKTSEKKK